jgi:bacterial/archaeal transporter family protein
MEIYKDWRFLIVVYLCLTGIWGVLIKIASNYLNPYTMSFVALTSAWVTVGVISFSKLNWQSNIGIAMAAICGCLGGVSALLFYRILKMAPASIVIPISSLYIVVTVILSYFFLCEPIGVKKIFGVIFGLIAIALLATT